MTYEPTSVPFGSMGWTDLICLGELLLCSLRDGVIYALWEQEVMGRFTRHTRLSRVFVLFLFDGDLLLSIISDLPVTSLQSAFETSSQFHRGTNDNGKFHREQHSAGLAAE